MAMERRLQFDRDVQKVSRVGSQLQSETGTPLFTGGSAVVPHQPGITGAEASQGGAVRLIMCQGYRPGATLQGFRTTIQFITEKTYDVHSPRPIFHSALYWLKASFLPDQYQQVFADVNRGDDAALPYAGTPFSASCFRNLYNDYYATQEYLITSESSKETQATLPPLVMSMEVVGDDELNLTYDEWVYLNTMYYPKNNKSQRLLSKVTKADMMAPTMLVPNSADAQPVVACKFAAQHVHSFEKNMIAIEPSFLCVVVGVWEQPNSETTYSTENWGETRYQGNSAGSTTLDRGTPHMVDEFRNGKAWLADPTDADPLGTITKGAQELSTINYFMSGEIGFDNDWDPRVIASDGTDSRQIDVTAEGTEGLEGYFSQVVMHHGESVLQTFPDAQ